VKEELKWYQDHSIVVRILNIPTTLMELPEGQEWVFDMVNNILIEVMGAIAQNELETMHRRVSEGIAAMPVDKEGYKVSPKTGNRFGRRKVPVKGFSEAYERVRDGLISASEAYKSLGISKSKWYQLCKSV
jgi:DNA invertase Pin-like site-specific DNA recombinase